MKRLKKRSYRYFSGFTLLEVVFALALTTVVLGAVFALLARGLKTPHLETERADVQAQTRSALDAISRDVLEAGADLPPEFPAFIPPQINPELLAGEGDAIELVGNLDDQKAAEPVRVRNFDGRIAQLESEAPHLRTGDLVLVYDDAPTGGTWMFGLVAEVRAGEFPELVLKTRPGESEGDVTLPWFIDNYNRPSPSSGFVTPVSVIHYALARDAFARFQGMPERVLMRRVNWGAPQPVAYAENLEIRYVIGSTVTDLNPPYGPPDRPQLRIQSEPAGTGNPNRKDDWSRNEGRRGRPRNTDDGVKVPPLPQADPRSPLEPEQVVRGVRITLTGRSQSPNLEGSRRANASDPNGFLRVTYTSRVAARNLLFRLGTRGQSQAFN